MLRALPMGEMAVCGGVPVGGQLVAAEQPRRPTLRDEGTGVHESVDADVVGLRHGDGVAGIARRRAERLEPVDAEAGFRVVARGLLARDLVASPVDERDGRAHGHRRVVWLQHPGAGGEDAHAGAYGFPAPRAAEIAVRTLSAETAEHPTIRRIVLCCFGRESRQAHERSLVSAAAPPL